ncbi:MAG: NUDIX hydrolase [Gammaproteobacteria bacterium]|nr:NUDIX hydrolase [Gammaproteobacteria bacterium]
MFPTDLTVAAVIENNGNYLLVEERAGGRVVLNQPGGHIESGESPERAVLREVLEETGCVVSCRELIGVYLWIHPQTRQQFLRIVYVTDFHGIDETRKPDENIVRKLWLTAEDIEKRRNQLRSPVVLRCVQDYASGRRQADDTLTGLMPLQNNVDAMIAHADLV